MDLAKNMTPHWQFLFLISWYFKNLLQWKSKGFGWLVYGV